MRDASSNPMTEGQKYRRATKFVVSKSFRFVYVQTCDLVTARTDFLDLLSSDEEKTVNYLTHINIYFQRFCTMLIDKNEIFVAKVLSLSNKNSDIHCAVKANQQRFEVDATWFNAEVLNLWSVLPVYKERYFFT